LAASVLFLCDPSSLWKDWMAGGEKEGRGRKGSRGKEGEREREEEGGGRMTGGIEVYIC